MSRKEGRPKHVTQFVRDPNRDKADALLKQVGEVIPVLSDACAEMDEKNSEEQIQSIIAEANKLLGMAKDMATKHRIEFSFMGSTLRFPENYDPYEVLGDEAYDMDEKEVQEKLKQVGPKFISDAAWDSSTYCSSNGGTSVLWSE